MGELPGAPLDWLRRRLRLLGPVLPYDLARAARRRRTFLLRTGYALLLFAGLVTILVLWALDRRGGGVRTRDMPLFAASFFSAFMGAQLALVVLLTPLYVGSAIAGEKDRRTLDFLLATDLTNAEIVLGKLVARVLDLALLLLAGLPILAFLQFLGGIDPQLLLAGFAATGLTLLSLAAVSVLASVLARRSRDAVVLTYVLLIGYLGLSGGAWAAVRFVPWLAFLPSVGTWTSPVTPTEVVGWLNAGNIATLVLDLGMQVSAGVSLNATLPAALRDYAVFHGLVTVVCAGWAVVRLRAAARRQAEGEGARAPAPRKAAGAPAPAPAVATRRPVGDRAMLWKEVFAEPGLRLPRFARVLLWLVALGSFAPALFWIAQYIDRFPFPPPRSGLGRHMSEWALAVGTSLECLLLLAVAARAAGSVSGERDRGTLDSLLASPLSDNEILFAKWAGSILGLRRGLLWLGAVWLLAVLGGGMSVATVLLVFTAWCVYAAAFAWLGLWVSAVSRTTLRATLGTFAGVALLSGGHWLLAGPCCYAPFSLMFSRYSDYKMVVQFELGLTPPYVLGTLAERSLDALTANRWKFWYDTVPCLVGVVFWAALAGLLWYETRARFGAALGRPPVGRQKGFKQEGGAR
jgi:ABC-type transport system involved in multi-copper enzyme maturation permease subunit